jgi:hypothetical protein
MLPATTSAGIAEDHDGSGGSAGFAAGPAFTEVRAFGLLANGVELELPELLLDLHVLFASRNGLLHPLRLGQGLLLGPDLHGIHEFR